MAYNSIRSLYGYIDTHIDSIIVLSLIFRFVVLDPYLARSDFHLISVVNEIPGFGLNPNRSDEHYF